MTEYTYPPTCSCSPAPAPGENHKRMRITRDCRADDTFDSTAELLLAGTRHSDSEAVADAVGVLACLELGLWEGVEQYYYYIHMPYDPPGDWCGEH